MTEIVESTTTDISSEVDQSRPPSPQPGEQRHTQTFQTQESSHSEGIRVYYFTPASYTIVISLVTTGDADTAEHSVVAIRDERKRFHQRFTSIRELTIKCLERNRIAVVTVVYMLTSIFTIDKHKSFLKENHKNLRKCEDHLELFGELNFYWSPLSCDLLDQLIEHITHKKGSIAANVNRQMTKYRKDLQKFRKRITLELFCHTEPNTEDDPPSDFVVMAKRYAWPATITLEAVEIFRKHYGIQCRLERCAVMLRKIGIQNLQALNQVYYFCDSQFIWYKSLFPTYVQVFHSSTTFSAERYLAHQACVWFALLECS